MKKTLKRVVWFGAILTLLGWFVHSLKNTFDDGISSGFMLMALLYIVRIFSRELSDSQLSEDVQFKFKRFSWFILIVLAFFGTHWKHNFDEGFSAGVLTMLAMWVLWPIAFDSYDRYLKAKEARKASKKLQAEEAAVETRVKVLRARWEERPDAKENHAKE